MAPDRVSAEPTGARQYSRVVYVDDHVDITVGDHFFIEGDFDIAVIVLLERPACQGFQERRDIHVDFGVEVITDFHVDVDVSVAFRVLIDCDVETVFVVGVDVSIEIAFDFDIVFHVHVDFDDNNTVVLTDFDVHFDPLIELEPLIGSRINVPAAQLFPVAINVRLLISFAVLVDLSVELDGNWL
ncbi:MAG TPA: hypothetical protein VGO04_32250 [Ensifer sp.]|uniref:hypothetical protein n=1 Tax=Ensifer sp. TaxID=1872086 RepID=UPI002E0FC087|nr:hypothetical protein [Ensifer sp.]